MCFDNDSKTNTETCWRMVSCLAKKKVLVPIHYLHSTLTFQSSLFPTKSKWLYSCSCCLFIEATRTAHSSWGQESQVLRAHIDGWTVQTAPGKFYVIVDTRRWQLLRSRWFCFSWPVCLHGSSSVKCPNEWCPKTEKLLPRLNFLLMLNSKQYCPTPVISYIFNIDKCMWEFLIYL